MALTQGDFVGAVARLNDLTRRQLIKWSPCVPTPRSHAGVSAAIAVEMFKQKFSFEATYDERILRITQFESLINPLLPGSYKYTLDVRDQDGSLTFQFPDVEGISDLFRSIQTQKLDIEGFIKKLATG
jgi:hypothetical protein